MKSMHDHHGEIRAARRKLLRAVWRRDFPRVREFAALLDQREAARLKAFRRSWGVPDEPIRMDMRTGAQGPLVFGDTAD